ncbi:site-specific integrase [Rhodothermus marinus]|uniref:site-specific integrase n=1 Tax=Rhodothermus marinus TaxID=29549 RepID=UPI0012BA4C92|nr:site-specific integrase [Rhodothermus marinus]BBM68222.1 integrase [Rhodothermus marinus]
MGVRIYLDRPGPDGRAPLRLALLRARRQCWLSLPVRVRPADWNRRRQRLRPSAPAAAEINARLEAIVARAEALLLTGQSLEAVRDRLKADLGLVPQEHRLLPLFDEWLAVKRLVLKPSSLQVLARVRKYLEAFAEDLTIERVDRAFLERFQAFLTTERGQSAATANRLAKYVRTFFLWLEERGLLEKAPKPLPLPEAKREIIFLTPEELRAFQEVDLSGLPEGYERARTIFLLACFTGLRASDLKAGMRPEAWDTIDMEAGVWHLREQKTGIFRRVPLVEPARRILRRRLEAGAPTPAPKLSEQKVNIYVKEIAERAGIVAPVRLGDGREVPKCQVLSLHAGRRTFVSLVAHTSGTAPLVGLTHADLDTLQKYLGAWDESRRRALEKAFRGL